jgi:hypothetical protein
VPDQEEPEQSEDLREFVEIEDDDDNYYGYHEGGWVDSDTEEEPMELPEDDPGAVEGDKAEDGDDDPAAPDGGDEDLDDDPKPANTVDQLPPIA